MKNSIRTAQLFEPLLCFILLTTLGTSWGQILQSHMVSIVNVPKTPATPTIDGKLDEPMWAQSKQIKEFRLTSGNIGDLAKERTECYLTYDDENFYIAFRCFEGDIANIKNECREWDDLDILFDDHVAVFLDLDHNHRNYLELAVNPSGVQMDRSGFSRYENIRTTDWDLDWNCFWKARTHIGADNWTVEIAIDMATLGIDRITQGKTIGFNLARVRHPSFEIGFPAVKKPTENCETSAYSVTMDGLWETLSNFYEPSMFGDLVFGTPKLNVTQIRFNRAKLNWGAEFDTPTFGWNPLEIDVDAKNPELKEVAMHLKVESETAGTWETSKNVTLSSRKPIQTDFYLQEDRESRLTIELVDPKTGDPLYNYTYSVTAPPFIEFDLEPLYQRKQSTFKPIGYRLRMDESTLNCTELKLMLYHQESKELIAEETVMNPSKSDDFDSFFDTRELRKLKGSNYFIKSELIDKATSKIIGTFIQNFTKFELNPPTEFGAIEGEYSFSGITDHAIRIQYPEGQEFVFWAAANYNPWWDIDQALLNHEHLETWGEGDIQGCAEVMQDREKRYSRVWLVENSPARVIVRWRYALADAHYNIHKNEWGEEIYTFFPDGTGLREVNLWANSTKEHEFMEIIPVKPGGVQSLQLYDSPIASLKTLEGDGYGTDVLWNESVDFYEKFLETSRDFVFEFNLKNRRHPYVIFSMREDLLPGVSAEAVDVGSPKRKMKNNDDRGHWPASLYAIDGYNSIGNDRPRHANMGGIDAPVVDYDNGKNKWVMFLGTEKEKGKDKYLHGKSWLYPAEIIDTSVGLSFKKYDPMQRAYLFSMDGNSDKVSFRTKSESILLNPVFMLDKKKAIKNVTINERELDSDKIKVGYSKEGETVIFLVTKIKENATISIQFG